MTFWSIPNLYISNVCFIFWFQKASQRIQISDDVSENEKVQDPPEGADPVQTQPSEGAESAKDGVHPPDDTPQIPDGTTAEEDKQEDSQEGDDGK